jgi:hypothetical protein
MAARVSILGQPVGQVAEELDGFFGGLDSPEDGLLNRSSERVN